jgi:hypothetical protein
MPAQLVLDRSPYGQDPEPKLPAPQCLFEICLLWILSGLSVLHRHPFAPWRAHEIADNKFDVTTPLGLRTAASLLIAAASSGVLMIITQKPAKLLATSRGFRFPVVAVDPKTEETTPVPRKFSRSAE